MNLKASTTRYHTPILAIYYFFISFMLLGFAEISCRFIEIIGPRTFVFRQFDDELGLSLIPNAAGVHRNCFDGYVSINAQGLRDIWRQTKKPPGTLRIGLFGDSILEGVHVYPDQLASRRLETRLNREACDGKCEVLNFSVGAYGTLQEWLRYKRDGRPFDLDIVVLLFIGNDVDNNLPETASYDENLYLAPYLSLNADGSEEIHRAVKPRLYGFLSFLTQRSAFFRFAYKAYFHWLYPKYHFTSVRDAAHFDTREGLNLQIDFLAADSEYGRIGWTVTERILDHFASDVRKDGADFIVFHSGYEIPNPTKRDIELAQTYEKVTGHSVDFNFAAKWFNRFSKRTEVPVFNWERYKEEYLIKNNLKDIGLGYSCDAHLNPDGHAVLADFFYQKLAPLVRAKMSTDKVILAPRQ